ncbi:MAG: O-antigen ligase family protein, partial [Brevundimonas sp.]
RRLQEVLRRLKPAGGGGSGRSRATFGPAGSRGELGWRATAGLSLIVAPIFLAHLMFGANQPLAAQVLTAFCAAALLGTMAFSRFRAALQDLRALTPVAVAFGLVVLTILVSLTDLVPGAAHPIWAWAGHAPAITVNRSATLLGLVQLLGLAAIFVAAAAIGARREWARRLVSVVLGAGLVWASLALILFLSGAQIGPEARLSGGLLSPNNGATVLGVLCVLATARALKAWRERGSGRTPDVLARWSPHAALLVLLIFALALTGSRMGLAATMASVMVLLIWTGLRGGDAAPRQAALGALILAVVGLIVALGHDLTFRRVAGLEDDVEIRGAIFSAQWRAFLDAPLWGWGLGSFSDVNSYLMTEQSYAALWRLRAAHNVYLQWLSETGLMGAVPMFATVALVIWRAAGRALAPVRGGDDLRGLVVANLVVLLHGLTDFALQAPSIAVFWSLLLGLQFGFGRTSRRA